MNPALMIFTTFAVLNFVACAHHDNDVSHHHHQEESEKVSYEGKCAYSVEKKQYDVPGKPEYNAKHEGVTYYFSSEEKMNEFKKDLAKHIQAANRSWADRGRRAR